MLHGALPMRRLGGDPSDPRRKRDNGITRPLKSCLDVFRGPKGIDKLLHREPASPRYMMLDLPVLYSERLCELAALATCIERLGGDELT